MTDSDGNVFVHLMLSSKWPAGARLGWKHGTGTLGRETALKGVTGTEEREERGRQRGPGIG